MSPVIVVARDAMRAARVEAAIRETRRCRVVVARRDELQTLVPEHPEAIVVLALPQAEARRLLRGARGWPRGPRIVALADDPAALWTPASRALGLRAALPLDATAGMLAAAVSAVQADLLVLHLEALAPARAADAALVAGTALTTRERQIVELMADGASNRVIAARLAISRHTVKFHVAAILAKLGARSRAEAVALALRRGVLAV
jgi:DNA-binding NarL/FixJ family response regulator